MLRHQTAVDVFWGQDVSFYETTCTGPATSCFLFWVSKDFYGYCHCESVRKTIVDFFFFKDKKNVFKLTWSLVQQTTSVATKVIFDALYFIQKSIFLFNMVFVVVFHTSWGSQI